MGPTDDRDLGDARGPLDDPLDLGRVDVGPAPVDQLGAAVADVQVALLVEGADVAGVDHPVDDRRRGRLGAVPVPEQPGEDARERAVGRRRQADLTVDARRDDRTIGVADGDLDLEAGHTRRPRRRCRTPPIHRDPRRRLGQAVGVREGLAEPLDEPLLEAGGRLAAADDEVHERRQIVPVDVGAGEQVVDERGVA